ncbi:hypothetical protein BOW49_12130 [Solemya velum gill symbiont]|uniref:hypothetical protein n=1 Tax=Solemya velum gill symbiont TaxID=2340 RepID=UPI000997FD47|nr:hypothetical protein [Solemya velum gill symbiont]OOZ71887.1 hypothetical protein BOW49_12130 [Solemya velum gill symbiont]
MENETQVEQPDNRERNAVHEKNKVQAKSARSSKKTILLAVVISVITIGALAIVRGQIDSPRKEAAAVGQSVAALDKTMASGIGADIDGMTIGKPPPQTGGTFDTIERSIGSLTERIGQWFDSLRADHSSMNRELSGLANTVSAIHESVAVLRKGNEDLKLRIDAAQSRLQAIAKDVRGLKIAAKKQVEKKQKSAAAKPPFHIDAIDLWDDAVYVAISQDGRVTFLREGEQRSGWNVTHIDRAKGQVAFRGPAGQDYSASLRR